MLRLNQEKPLQTKVVQGTDPIFNQFFQFDIEDHTVDSHQIELSLMNYNSGRSTVINQVKLPLRVYKKPEQLCQVVCVGSEGDMPPQDVDAAIFSQKTILRISIEYLYDLRVKLVEKISVELSRQERMMDSLNQGTRLLRSLEKLDIVPFNRKGTSMEIEPADREADKGIGTFYRSQEVAIVGAFAGCISWLHREKPINWLHFLRALLVVQMSLCLVE